MIRRSLDEIYATIPPVQGCRRGCSDCCGPIPLGKPEVDRIVSDQLPIRSVDVRVPGDAGFYATPTSTCGGCAYATPAGCSIYEVRPFICRLFGAVEGSPDLTCPHGARAEQQLSVHEAFELGMEYLDAIGIQGGRR